MEERNWLEVERICKRLRGLHKFVVDSFAARKLPSTAVDRIGGLASGFLKISLRSRGPYQSASQEDVELLRGWYKDNFPEMLEWGIGS